MAAKIQPTTSANTFKFYWLKHKVENPDYPSMLIGTLTPSIFRWSKMTHLLDVMDAIRSADPKNPEPVIKCGTDEYTALEFLYEIGETKMWTFEMGL